MPSATTTAAFAFFTLTALSAMTFQIDAAAARKDTEGETERIIGGATAEPGQFPWAAALHYDGNFICTSSIISPTTVLTAAHCVVFNGVTEDANRFYAIANVSKSAPSVRIDFQGVTPHPDYNDQNIDNDIAILKTSEPIQMGNEVQPICIAAPDSDKEYKNATAMGWGRISRLFNIIPDKLQYVEQKIVSNSLCSWINGGINEDKICAKGVLNGICNGDSGRPLVHLSADNRPVEIGIASYINGLFGCGSLAPGVWTRVSSHYDFIMQAAEDASICSSK